MPPVQHLLVDVVPKDTGRIRNVLDDQVSQCQLDVLGDLDVAPLPQAGRYHLAVQDTLAGQQLLAAVIVVQLRVCVGREPAVQPKSGRTQDGLEPVKGHKHHPDEAAFAVFNKGGARNLNTVVADVPLLRVRVGEYFAAADVAGFKDAHRQHCNGTEN